MNTEMKLLMLFATAVAVHSAGVCVSRVNLVSSAEADANVQDSDPNNGGLLAIIAGAHKAVKGDTCKGSIEDYKACEAGTGDDANSYLVSDANYTKKCCVKTAGTFSEMCDGNPKNKIDEAIYGNTGIYHIGRCKAKQNANGDWIANKDGTAAPPGAAIINKNQAECGPIQVIQFPEGKMILEYNPGEAPCTGGMFLPFFPGEFIWSHTLQTVLFAITMLFSFLGIAIIADVFMAAIEKITSKTYTITHTDPKSGKAKKLELLVWNGTIANLTLMALGSSAPEILLSVLETLALLNKEAEPGGLGPGTIVGSAAFNLLVICAICVMAIPKAGGKETGVRKIKQMGVFTCTAVFSVVAYVWLYLCVEDNNVSIAEAFITFLLFPVMVVLAYWLDKRGKKNAVAPADSHIVGTDGMGARNYGTTDDLAKKLGFLEASAALGGLLAEQERKQMSPKQIAEQKKKVAQLAVAELQSQQKVSIMQAKINARRGLAGRPRVVAAPGDPAALQQLKDKANERSMQKRDQKLIKGKSVGSDHTYIHFASPVYSVFEDKGTVNVEVVRSGNTSSSVCVYYNTVDGEAVHDQDFVYQRGSISFLKGETSKTITIKLIDDNDYEPDESFYIELKQPKEGKKGTFSEAFEFLGSPECQIIILEDDKPGTISFEKAGYSVSEASGHATLKIKRTEGADGEIKVRVTTVDGSAKAGTDYTAVEQTITFADMQSEQVVDIGLVEDDEYEKEEYFTVKIELLSKGLRAGENAETTITIVQEEAYAKLAKEVAELMALKFESLSSETETWGDQFKTAMNVCGGDAEASASTVDYVMHFLTFGWKVLFATVPPTSYKGGWVTFFVALGYIGVLTAFVADIASIFGCLLGLDDAITAITFVALGTSLPDTFASKTAAVNDDSADASVGNVTGSNSVNVFLGLGLPWVLATVINTSAGFTPNKTKGNKGDYPMISGSLGFSVIIFAICAITCIATIYLRRYTLGYELGGKYKNVTGAFFCTLWLVYVMISSLETKGKIESFM